MVNLLAIHSEEIWAPAQATEDIPITQAVDGSNMKIDSMMKAKEEWTIQMSKANDSRYGGYQTARTYTIQGNHSHLQLPINIPYLTSLSGPAYNQQGHNHQQYSQ